MNTFNSLVRTLLGTFCLFSPAVMALDGVANGGGATVPVVDRSVDWPSMLAQCDMRWDRMPLEKTGWKEGPFVGNGLVGAQVYTIGTAVAFTIGRTDVFDHRPMPAENNPGVAFLHARLSIGKLLLQPVGKITACDMRLDIYNAELTGTLTTDRGSIRLRLLAPAENPTALLLDTQTTGDEKAFKVTWQQDESKSSRYDYITHFPAYWKRYGSVEEALKKYHLTDYKPNPPAVAETSNDIQLSIQNMLAGGAYVTALREQATGDQRNFTLSVGYSQEKEQSARDEAVHALDCGDTASRAATIAAHQAWWHRFWPESFISVPDARLTQFYWLQMYKMASASRTGRPALDLYGPWTHGTPWPYFCWNMNVQVAYSPWYAANRLELSDNLTQYMHTNEANLIANAGGPQDEAAIHRSSALDFDAPMGDFTEWGNLPWALHNVYKQFRFAGDDERLLGELYPLLEKSMNFYLHRLRTGDDGKLHLPTTISPEYGTDGPDCNYDLSLLRWGLGVLLNYADRAHATDARKQQWQSTLDHLTPYPKDETGLLIAKGVPLTHAHRHFSHLLMIYPLRTMDPNDPKNRELIKTSLDHWMTMPGTDRLGFTYVGSASIRAILGDGDGALADINTALGKTVFANTMYLEGCIESPLGMCDALQNMLLESDDRGLTVFPAIPTTWKDVSFDDLRAEGAFLVSAARTARRTGWVRVKSLHGEPLTLRIDIGKSTQFKSDDPAAKVQADGGVYHVTLAAGKSILFYDPAQPVQPRVLQPVIDPALANYYGLHQTGSSKSH